MVKGIAERVKRYVEVSVIFDVDGKMQPEEIHWFDGTIYKVDEVLDVQRRASLKVGGSGLRFFIRIGRSKTYLYFEQPRWFVEEIVLETEIVL
jgi:hypothetical protein